MRKTFTPDMQGDFTGGGIDIRTKSIPEGPTYSVSGGVEHDSLATNNERFLTYVGGGVNTRADGSDSRVAPAIPEGGLPPMPRASFRPTEQQMNDARTLDAFVRAFDPVMGVSRGSAEINRSVSLLGGDRVELGRFGVLGLLGALTHSRKANFYEEGVNNKGVRSDPSAPITIEKNRTDSRVTEEVLMGLLGTVVWQPSEKNEFAFRAIYNRSAEDEARFQWQPEDPGTIERNQTLNYTERVVSSLQLHGEHEFERFLGFTGGEERPRIDWLIADNKTVQDQPDVRFFRNLFSIENFAGEVPDNSTAPQNTRRTWRRIDEVDNQFQADLTLPFVVGGARDATLELGVYKQESDRVYDEQAFYYQFTSFQLGSFLDPTVRFNRSLGRFQGESIDDLWTDVFLEDHRIGLASNDPPAPNQMLWVIRPLDNQIDYTAAQEIDAFYAMLEYPLTERLTLVGGARRETTDLGIVPTNAAFGTVQVIEQLSGGDRVVSTVPEEEGRASIDESSTLPALGASYAWSGNSKLRVSWSETIARPTFRELAPIATSEFLDGDEFLGNPSLVFSSIANYDVRWEWFPRPGEVIAAGVFYKSLDDPIELISFSASNRDFIQPVNYEKGEVFGFEVEGRSALDVVWKRLANFSVGVNFAYIDSEVDVPLAEQRSLRSFALDEPTRRLQAQPDWVLNVNLTYDNKDRGTSAGLFFNMLGETLVTGAAKGTDDGTPNVFEKGYASLNFSMNQKFGEHVSVSFKVKNLLTSERERVYRTPDGYEAVKSKRESPLKVSGSVSYKW